MAILQALAGRPAFGLEIGERVLDRTKGKLKLGAGSLYPTLRALEREGLIESFEADEALQVRGGMPRRYYRLTGLGSRTAAGDRKAIAGLFSLELASKAVAGVAP